ncbi:DUF721 domain-containing protein [Sneathiella sp.]|uniref:DUF721 domain-containing protein n=1 Tax=Sneathiella sp. TaxID=1964365 RepID=UPI00262735EA|nr:DciA family protein [Sneathiella sp.]MDF2365795.1 DciA family protein [Sneathiella sp.]
MRKAKVAAGPRAIASLIGKSSKAALIKRGFAQADILNQWSAIVGPNLANYSSPEKFSYSRQGNKDATLRIRVAPGWAPEFQHFEPLVIERINSFFGYRAVARLQLIQAPVKKPEIQKPAPSLPLTESQKVWIETILSDVSEPDLKKRLESVATSMLSARNKTQKRDDPDEAG